MATPTNPETELDFNQPLNTGPDFTSLHVFSTDDITGNFDGVTQGVDGSSVNFDAPAPADGVVGITPTKQTKEGITLYPVNSAFGFIVTDSVGAEEKTMDDGLVNEGWVGDFTANGGDPIGAIAGSLDGTFGATLVAGAFAAEQ